MSPKREWSSEGVKRTAVYRARVQELSAYRERDWLMMSLTKSSPQSFLHESRYTSRHALVSRGRTSLQGLPPYAGTGTGTDGGGGQGLGLIELCSTATLRNYVVAVSRVVWTTRFVYKTIKVAAGESTREVLKSAVFQADLAAAFFKALTYESRLSALLKKGNGRTHVDRSPAALRVALL